MFWLAVVVVLGLVVLGLLWLSDYVGVRKVLVGLGVFAVFAFIAIAIFVHVNSGVPRTRVAHTAKVASNTTTGAATTAGAGRPPQQVRVEVINAAGIPNAAATKAEQLRAIGYEIAGTANASTQQGSTVACKPAFDREAIKLASSSGAGTTVTPFPNPAPKGALVADCVVILGR
jgi:hypothetical protein